MKKRTNQRRAPIKRPAKRPYLAGKAFAEKAKKAEKKAKKHAAKKLDNLRKEVIAAKERNNQEHFAFATSIVGGGVAANFIAFQTGGASDIPAKMLTTATIGGLLLGLNKDFFFTSGVFKEMLRTANSLYEDNNNGKVVEVPNFKQLRDQATKTTRQNRKDFKSATSQNIANAAVILITSLALANLGYKIYKEINIEPTNPEQQAPITEVIKENQESNLVSPSPTHPQ